MTRTKPSSSTRKGTPSMASSSATRTRSAGSNDVIACAISALSAIAQERWNVDIVHRDRRDRIEPRRLERVAVLLGPKTAPSAETSRQHGNAYFAVHRRIDRSAEDNLGVGIDRATDQLRSFVH